MFQTRSESPSNETFQALKEFFFSHRGHKRKDKDKAFLKKFLCENSNLILGNDFNNLHFRRKIRAKNEFQFIIEGWSIPIAL